MTRLAAIWSRLREHGARGRIDAEFQEELRSHLETLRDEHVRRGMAPADAHRAALLEIGGFEQTRELVNERRGFLTLDHLQRDIRHALFGLRKSPGFAVVAVLTLALGIGANAAIFSFINAVIIRPLPYPDADGLMSVWEAGQDGEHSSIAPANMGDYRNVSAFADIAGYSTEARSLTGGGQPEGHTAELVTYNYFNVLRVQPAIGRAFRADEDAPAGRKVVIVSHALWQGRFAGDPAIVGRTASIDGITHEIIGVMPAGFRGVSEYGARDARHLWLPAAYPAELLANRGDHEIHAIARLRDGASPAAAEAELRGVAEALAKAYPGTNANTRAGTQPLRDEVVRHVRRSLATLMLTVALILTIACVNVANLLIARGVGRRREIAVRYALGASRARVYTALITESVVLALLASVVGLALGVWIKGLLVSVAPASMPRLAEVALDARVIMFTLAVSLVTGIVFGALPAWQAGKADPVGAMSSGSRVVAGRGVMRWRNALMVAQLALSALLLVGAGLMIKSLVRLNGVELGFDTSAVVAIRTTLPPAKYPTGEARYAFFEELERRLESIPGVVSAGFVNTLPLRGGWSSGFAIEGVPDPPKGHHEAGFQAVSPGYFKALGMPVLRGRAISGADRQSSMPVAVVSAAFERQLLGGRSALGVRFSRGGRAGTKITIVGVVGDVRRGGKADAIEPQVYLPAAQTGIYPVRLADVAVRSSGGNPLDLVPAIRAAVWSIDPDQPVTNVRTLDDLLLAQSAERRFQTLLFSIFAALALVLASIGTYGVIAYLVSQRTPEIGVRIALGASRGRIYRWLLGRTALLVVAGSASGIILARLLARFVEAMLFDVRTGDVATYAAAAGVLVAVALMASLIAVRRAARISPTVALRYE